MEKTDNLLYCYNTGCGQRFDPAANAPDSCVHHPGVPVFHDAYKSWSCCQKKTTDFTDFLGIRGCTIASHNSQKPLVEKTKTEICIVNKNDQKKENEMVQQRIKTLSVQERPDKNTPTIDLNISVIPSLKAQLEQLENKVVSKETQNEVDATVPIGTCCKNGGCRKTFQSEADDAEDCLYHPGQPIFHEGLKFWSCCVRRTSDFNSFLEQCGCTTGSHLWIKPKNPDQDKVSCRYDWYQTGSHVFVSVYAKTPIPSLSRVTANPVFLSVRLIFGEEKFAFQLDLDLFGIVDVQKSEVTYSSNKVEIKLKKGEPAKWTKLVIRSPPNQS